MNFNNNKVSAPQLGSIILLTVVGTGILTLPRALAENVGSDGWLLILLGTLLSAAVVLIHSHIVKSFPNKGYMEIISTCLSKPVAYIVVALLVVYFIILNGFLVRLFAEVVKLFLLLRTPIEIIIFSLLLLGAYLARQGIETLGRLAELLIPIVLVPSLILFLLSLEGGDLGNLYPILKTPIPNILKEMPTILFSFLGFDVLLIFGLYVNKPQKIAKSATRAILFIGALYLVLNLSVIVKFGVPQTTHLIWPTISLFKTIDFPGLFIENVEGVVMGIWVLIVFMSIAPILLVKVILLQDLFSVKDNKCFALPLLPPLYFVALWGASLAESYAYLDKFVTYTAPIVTLGIPGLILIVMTFKKKNKKEGEPNA
ncbi:GerAB/ArcD/ProY family transporter [Alkaliphilus hydrothermalis]|uniref:Spore germination protein n=1 Tax=Alkaliphilus hydrothermalis TaxID=1482730 RepID=A0ABS2NSL2_9FIRM|nr:endospore germination permease [Alkaliphilus hydrothermalis]MBM7615950.1 spore germination protein [Alkaliphilus hydrothermalis]